jgi:hypothetical protein
VGKSQPLKGVIHPRLKANRVSQYSWRLRDPLLVLPMSTARVDDIEPTTVSSSRVYFKPTVFCVEYSRTNTRNFPAVTSFNA